MTDWTALVAAALLMARVAKTARPERFGRVLAAAVFVGCLVPLAGLPIAGYVRGHIGDLSASTVALLALSFGGPIRPRQRRAVAVTFTVAGAGLYPMALGVGPVDPYRYGYAPFGLLVVVLVLAVFAMVRGLDVLVICLASALIGYGFGMLESTNLWDYLIDPWLVMFGIFELLRLRWSRRPEALG